MRLLCLILLAQPLCAQYPAGAVFQRGDDPRWAAPDFDDRQWVKQNDYRANSYDDYLQNRSWMRARVTIPAGEPAVIVSQHCPCEFYVNGLRVAAIGDLDQPRPHTPREIRIFPRPAGIPPGEAVFAVRRYDPPGLENVGLTWARSSALLVPASGADQALEQFEKTNLTPGRFIHLFVLFALAALLGATWGQRKDAAFWVALALEGCSLLALTFLNSRSIGSADQANMNSIGWSFVIPTVILPTILLVLIVPGVNRRLWLSACLLAEAIRIPFFVAAYYGVPPAWLPLAVVGVEAGAWLIVVTAFVLVTLAYRLGGIPRPLLLFCVLGPLCALLMRLAPKLQLPQQIFVFELPWNWSRLSQVFYSLTVAALVIWRAQVRRRQELRQQEELAAAQEVQSLLLASPYQANPRLQIETAYVPASAVGGDFYYVRDFADGSQVAVVGDVSGKGLKAAMVVSVAIGILRTVKSSSPAAILATMNDGLAGQTGSGFVTACCARFDADGSAVLANAGHPAPYVDGRELEMESGLSLGVVAGVVYEESVSRGERFTFVSDGVVEAEDASRELFGFDRTREISTRSAQEIAEAAKAWGQNDDITVVTVRRSLVRAPLLLILTVIAASAQTIEVESLFQPAPLSGMWKHQVGDDPRWADPAFDDSAWPSVRMPESAIQADSGVSWYRFRVRLPENMPKQPLALMVGAFGDSQAYEIFWNGKRAGAIGAPDGGGAGQMIGAPQTIPVVVDGREAVVAIRLRTRFTPLSSISDPAHRTSWLGTKDAVGDRWQTLRGERLRTVLPLLLMAASLLLSSLLFLLLPLWRRDAPEYFWFGLWLLSANGVRVLQAYPDIVGLESSQAAIWGLVLVGSGLIVGWFGWMRSLFAGRMTKALWFSLVVCLATVSGAVLRFNPGAVTPLSNFVSLMLLTVLQAFAYFQLGWRTSRGRDRMPAVHLAILAYFAVNSASYTTAFLWQTEAVAIQGSLARTVSLLLFAFAMTILMNQRSARLVAERQRLSGEMASAAEVQSLLLGSMPAAGDSYQIEPVYLPASEVGGDFYRIFPTGDGAILVVVGDVSGKGLRAAMTVSGLTCAMEVIRTRSPGAFLAELNRAAAAHLQSGFATCCAALIQLDGEAVIANAGHPAPYCDGRELVLEGGLPLGIAAEGEYPETIVRGERFTFVSDGVVEAENAQRELFGFDRTRDISTKSAQEIAEAAKAWGQNDDITVVTVRRNA